MGSPRWLRVTRWGWPRAECQNLVRMRKERQETVIYRGTDPISKYSEVMGPRCLTVGKGRYREKSRINPVMGSGNGRIAVNS